MRWRALLTTGATAVLIAAGGATAHGGVTAHGDAGGWASVSAATSHTCAIRADGSLWCWGSNGAGRLGDGTTDGERTTPGRVGDGTDWTAVSAAAFHTCGIRAGGSLWCWGYNGEIAHLGDGTKTDRQVPVPVGADATWRAVSAAHYHSCAIRTDGTLWCWGNNDFGQLGDGTTATRYAPTEVGTDQDWASVSAGTRRTCGTRTDGSLWCWGFNLNGLLGDGTTADRHAPTRVGTDRDWASVSAAWESNTCGVRTGGTLWCWGSGDHGMLGDSGRQTTPQRIGTETGWTGVATGSAYACATSADGGLWCWGRNNYGSLGDGSTEDRPTPARVGDGAWTAVTAGGGHACAVRTDGSLWCWGFNYYGQLGNGTVRETQPSPCPVAEPRAARAPGSP